MKVFISHQRLDSELAKRIATHLSVHHRVESYLDVVEPAHAKKGEALALHLRSELGRCTQLLAVVSFATQNSWWVPWEIGIATEKEYPLATYVESTAQLPDYLRRWPYLRSKSDLDAYVAASRASEHVLLERTTSASSVSKRTLAAATFFSELRQMLRQ